MTLPSPDDLSRVPVWENYTVAQATQASLRLIPRHALAYGVETSGTSLRLRFQLSEITESDEADISDIVNELEALVGDDIEVTYSCETMDRYQISPTDGVHWIFLAHPTN